MIVITGKYKGKVSTIQKFVDADHCIVKGINEMKKAMKGKGFIKKIHPIHVSNVMYYVDDKKTATRINVVTDKKGKKTREATKLKVAIK